MDIPDDQYLELYDAVHAHDAALTAVALGQALPEIGTRNAAHRTIRIAQVIVYAAGVPMERRNRRAAYDRPPAPGRLFARYAVVDVAPGVTTRKGVRVSFEAARDGRADCDPLDLEGAIERLDWTRLDGTAEALDVQIEHGGETFARFPVIGACSYEENPPVRPFRAGSHVQVRCSGADAPGRYLLTLWMRAPVRPGEE